MEWTFSTGFLTATTLSPDLDGSSLAMAGVLLLIFLFASDLPMIGVVLVLMARSMRHRMWAGVSASALFADLGETLIRNRRRRRAPRMPAIGASRTRMPPEKDGEPLRRTADMSGAV